MRVDIITVLPELLDGPFSASILKRAQEKGLAEIHVHNLRDYSTHRQKSVDDYAFGGGAGMVMTLEPIDNCISALKAERDYDEIIYMTPDGEELTQAMSNSFSLKGNLMILCGHYKGIDERAREAFITKEISIGSYVLSGILGVIFESESIISIPSITLYIGTIFIFIAITLLIIYAFRAVKIRKYQFENNHEIN